LAHLHWTDSSEIVPVWPKRGHSVLTIPADRQKNDGEESIPMLPEFEALLLETPLGDRTGWVFRPQMYRPKMLER